MIKLRIFLFLSVCDLALTGLLLSWFQSEAFELNPIANWIFTRLGWPGLITFKFIMVAIVVIICNVICSRKPRVANRLLTFACIALILVVTYSCYVSWVAMGAKWRRAQIESRHDRLLAKEAYAAKHKALIKRLSRSLIADSLTLDEAVQALERSVKEWNYLLWSKDIMRIYQCDTHSSALAAFLIDSVSADLEQLPTLDKKKILNELDAEYWLAHKRRRPAPIS